jgi:hypothetical protein
MRSEKTQINKIRNEKEGTTANIMEIIRDYIEKIYLIGKSRIKGQISIYI